MRKSRIEKFKAKPNAKTQFAKKVKTLLFSRLAVVVALLLLQLIVYIVIFSRLQRYITFLWRGSVIASVFFLTYIVNTHDKNEFKITWIFPVLVLPIFGISFYFLYKYNIGGIRLRKKILSIKKSTVKYIPHKKDVQKVIKKFPEIQDIASYLYNYANCASYTDSDTKYFSSGEDFFEDVIEELKKAKQFIFIEFFTIEPCQILDKLLEILSAKIKAGVDIRILFDGIGSVALSSSILKDYFTSFGINSRVWQKLVPIFNSGFNNRDHRKIICIDGKVAFTGGINITDEYANIVSKRFNYWKDAGIKVSGLAASSFTLMFLQLWNVQNKKNQPYDKFAKFVSKRPVLYKNSISKKKSMVIPYTDDAFNNEEVAENIYKYILSHAKKSVYIMTPYIIIDESMVEALIFTARRGVQVEIIVPNHYDHFIAFCLGRNFIKTLIKNGIKIFAYDTGFIHSKVFVADKQIGTVGSVNLDYRSFYHHFECGVFLYNTKSIVDATKDFEKTKLECTEITKSNYKSISKFVRLVGWLFRLCAPIM